MMVIQQQEREEILKFLILHVAECRVGKFKLFEEFNSRPFKTSSTLTVCTRSAFVFAAVYQRFGCCAIWRRQYSQLSREVDAPRPDHRLSRKLYFKLYFKLLNLFVLLKFERPAHIAKVFNRTLMIRRWSVRLPWQRAWSWSSLSSNQAYWLSAWRPDNGQLERLTLTQGLIQSLIQGLIQALSDIADFRMKEKKQNVFGQFERASNLNLVLSSSTCQLKADDTEDEPCPRLFEEEAVACKCMTCARREREAKREAVREAKSRA